MPDFKVEIRARLAELQLSPVREAEIVEELSQHLEAGIRAGGQRAARRKTKLANKSSSNSMRPIC